MIRIVDILKKAADNDNNKNKPAAKPPVKAPPQEPDQRPPAERQLSAEELRVLFSEIIEAFRTILAGRAVTPELEAKGRTIGAAAAKLAAPLGLSHPDLCEIVERLTADEFYVHALRLMVNAVKIGQDANYSQEKLQELAVAALTYGIRLGNPAAGNNLKLLSELMGKMADLDTEAYKSIINLAEIYEHTA